MAEEFRNCLRQTQIGLVGSSQKDGSEKENMSKNKLSNNLKDCWSYMDPVMSHLNS